MIMYASGERVGEVYRVCKIMLPSLLNLNFNSVVSTAASLHSQRTVLSTGPSLETPIEKQRRRDAEKRARVAQKLVDDAVEFERKRALNLEVRAARASVKHNPPMHPSLYGLGIGQSGVTVIPFADASQLDDLRGMLAAAFDSSPEFKPFGVYGPSTFDNDNFVPVEGGFAGLATPSSFHNECVRKIRMAAHVAVLRAGAIPIANDCAFEQIADRVMIRRSRKVPGVETWHRDVAKFSQPGDNVYGGWVNLDETESQFFSMCPWTADEISDGRNDGFETIVDTEAPFNIRRSVRVEIPPGCIMIFNERTIHEVLAISPPPGVTKARLFMGWRTTRSSDPITPNLQQRLHNQEALPLKSGQKDHAHMHPPPGAESLMRSIVGSARYDAKPTDYKYPGPPPMYSPMHLTSRANAKLLENLGTHFKTAVLVVGGKRFANPDGELSRAFPAPNFLQTVPRFLLSLRELNARDPSITMYPDYSATELSILWPNIAWTNLMDLSGRRVALKLVPSTTGYKNVQFENE